MYSLEQWYKPSQLWYQSPQSLYNPLYLKCKLWIAESVSEAAVGQNWKLPSAAIEVRLQSSKLKFWCGRKMPSKSWIKVSVWLQNSFKFCMSSPQVLIYGWLRKQVMKLRLYRLKDGKYVKKTRELWIECAGEYRKRTSAPLQNMNKEPTSNLCRMC